MSLFRILRLWETAHRVNCKKKKEKKNASANEKREAENETAWQTAFGVVR